MIGMKFEKILLDTIIVSCKYCTGGFDELYNQYLAYIDQEIIGEIEDNNGGHKDVFEKIYLNLSCVESFKEHPAEDWTEVKTTGGNTHYLKISIKQFKNELIFYGNDENCID
ncbi:MAG: hypothetical protein KKF27_21835 [Gammaproteobacteria bacterium]|nr:hypothetical protein [Gammaproteobacteria bacterium]